MRGPSQLLNRQPFGISTSWLEATSPKPCLAQEFLVFKKAFGVYSIHAFLASVCNLGRSVLGAGDRGKADSWGQDWRGSFERSRWDHAVVGKEDGAQGWVGEHWGFKAVWV